MTRNKEIKIILFYQFSIILFICEINSKFSLPFILKIKTSGLLMPKEMLKLKRALKASSIQSKRLLNPIMTYDDQKEIVKEEQKLQSLFLSEKRMLSVLLRIQNYKQQFQESEKRNFIEQTLQKVNFLQEKINEEYEFFLSLRQQFERTSNRKLNKQFQLNSLKTLNRRTKMLLRLIIPDKNIIYEKEEYYFSKYLQLLTEEINGTNDSVTPNGNPLKQLNQTNQINRFKCEEKKTTKNINRKKLEKVNQKEKHLQIQNIMNNINSLIDFETPEILKYFFQIAKIFIKEITQVKHLIHKNIRKQRNHQKSTKKLTCTFIDKMPVSTNLIPNINEVTNIFKSHQEIVNIKNLLKYSYYQFLEVQNIEAYSHMIPGVQPSTNISINFDKQKKRNKKIIKDINNYMETYNKVFNKKYSKSTYVATKKDEQKLYDINNKKNQKNRLRKHPINNKTQPSSVSKNKKIRIKVMSKHQRSNSQQYSKINSKQNLGLIQKPIIKNRNTQNFESNKVYNINGTQAITNNNNSLFKPVANPKVNLRIR